MIFINMPTQQDYVIDVLNDKTFDGIHYTYKGKQGKMKLLFDAQGEGDPVSTAKAAIKASPLGTALYFQVGSVD